MRGARGGTRTHTLARATALKAALSTNSSTRALNFVNYTIRLYTQSSPEELSVQRQTAFVINLTQYPTSRLLPKSKNVNKTIVFPRWI